ncbi:MAG: AAA family ATPase [Candidatus Dormibacteraceae bacterium]
MTRVEKVEPEFSFARGIARATWSDPAVELKFDLLRLDRRAGELSAEVTVLSLVGQLDRDPDEPAQDGMANGSADLLHRARLNLGSTRSRADFTNHLAKRLAGPDWPGLVESAAWKVIEAYRQGAPAFYLKDAQEPAAAGWALEPLVLARDPVIFFGDGGSLKSYTGLATGIALQTGLPLADGLEPARTFRVAYLDFEWNPWPHHRRLRALCGPGELPEILYVPCQTSGPLSHQVERLQRIFQEHGIDYAFIDSVGLACDGPPEEAQSALGFFQALGRLEVGSTLIAHTNREGDTMKPFGSAFWHNSARMTWYLKRERANGSSAVDVGLYNRKANDDALREQPLGLRYEFSDHSTTIRSIDVANVPQLEAQTLLRDRMARTLDGGAKTALQLAAELGVPANSIAKTATRWEGRYFVKVTDTPDGVHRIGLVAPERTPVQ